VADLGDPDAVASSLAVLRHLVVASSLAVPRYLVVASSLAIGLGHAGRFRSGSSRAHRLAVVRVQTSG
jgi:hypothetical protein